MTTRLKVHKVMLCIHTMIFMFSIAMAWFCLVGIKYSSIDNTILVILAISQLTISAYSARMGVLYEKSVARMKRKLGK